MGPPATPLPCPREAKPGHGADDCETEGALDVPAGTYVVEMLTDAETTIGMYGGILIVEWLPFDGFGS